MIQAFPLRVKLHGKGQFRYNINDRGEVDYMALDIQTNKFNHGELPSIRNAIKTYHEGQKAGSSWRR